MNEETGYCALMHCRRPKDHEIHDERRARRAGWKYHAFASEVEREETNADSR